LSDNDSPCCFLRWQNSPSKKNRKDSMVSLDHMCVLLVQLTNVKPLAEFLPRKHSRELRTAMFLMMMMMMIMMMMTMMMMTMMMMVVVLMMMMMVVVMMVMMMMMVMIYHNPELY
jgi:hypothetical protein